MEMSSGNSDREGENRAVGGDRDFLVHVLENDGMKSQYKGKWENSEKGKDDIKSTCVKTGL